MKHLVDVSMICPVVVGRAPQLRQAAALVARVEAGESGPRVLLVEGEAGIGKSRLVSELANHVRHHGWTTVAGSCFEPDQSLPYAPLLELAPTLWRLAQQTGGATLAAMAAAVRPLVPDLAPPPGDDAALDPQMEQRRIFRGLAQLCEHVAAPRPLLLVVEDLQWSDAVTLDWLLYLARQAAAQPILIALTVRTDEPAATLDRFLAELERQRLGTTLLLQRLGRDDVGTLLRATLAGAQPVGPALIDAIHRLTDGNPFFIEESLKALAQAGTLDRAGALLESDLVRGVPIPRTVQDVVRRRTALLSDDARALLTLATVIGRRFDFETLARASERDEAAIVRLLKELIGAQLLVEVGPDQLGFRHGLVRDALYTTLLERERRAYHRQLFQVIAQTDPERHAALAYHAFEAGDWEAAYHQAEQAANAATRLFAPHEVIAQTTRALAAARQLPAVPLAPLHHLRGQAYETLGAFEAARSDYEAALEQARAQGNRQDAWQALLDLGFLWSARDYARSGAYLDEMLALARAMDDARLLAASLNRVGNWQLNQDRPLAAQPYHQEALALFQQLDDAAGLAATFDLLGITHYLAGDLERGTAFLEAAVSRNTTLDNRSGIIQSLVHLTLRAEFDLEALDRPLAAMGATAERAAELARTIGARSAEAFALSDLGSHLVFAGDYGGALRAARRSLAIAEEIEHHEFIAHSQVVLGRLALALLDPAAAVHALEPALKLAQHSGSLLQLRVVAGALVVAYTAQGDLTAATALLPDALGPANDPAEAPSMLLRQVRAAEAELLLAQGQPELALLLVEQLIATTANRNGAIPRLWLLRGQALADLRRDDAEQTLLAGLAAAETQAARPLAARIAVELCHLYERQHRRAHADEMTARARALLEALAVTLEEDAVRAQYFERALALLPARAPLRPREAAKQAFDGLTAREREVAVLIAQGYSNRQIAEALVLSERTVTTHIGNILGKLGLTSRTQVARWAIEKGLGSA